MPDSTVPQAAAGQEPANTTLERFLKAIEEKTKSPVHRCLLAACREEDPMAALETVLLAAITEILHEA